MNKKDWLEFKKGCPWYYKGYCENFDKPCAPENCYTGFIKYKYPLECGTHYTADKNREGGYCYKCRNYQELKQKGLLQYYGTPWIAILGEISKLDPTKNKKEVKMKCPKKGQKVKAIVNWGRSKLNGIHIGTIIGNPFRAKSGAILNMINCETCGKKHCIPWTSNINIIKFEIIEEEV